MKTSSRLSCWVSPDSCGIRTDPSEESVWTLLLQHFLQLDFFKPPTSHRLNSWRLTTSTAKCLRQVQEPLPPITWACIRKSCLDCRRLSAFLPKHMGIPSRTVMVRESPPQDMATMAACRILSTILSFSLLFILDYCPGDNKDAFCDRKINFRDVVCDTNYYQY